MKTYKERENELFDRWDKYAKERGEKEDFASDGILYRGEFSYDGGCWNRHPGNETELWDNAPKRLLILTKDSTKEGELDDVRIEAGRVNGKGADVVRVDKTNWLYRNLHLWSYGLLTACRGEGIRDFPSESESECESECEKFRKFYEKEPIARMNCKKQMGDSRILPGTLKYYLDTYKEFITEQIEMYDADIILCCGGPNLIKDFVKENYLPDIEPVAKDKPEQWAYYSASKNKLVINSYHPSYFRAKAEKGKKTYEAMMKDVELFLKEHPDFTKSGR